MSRAVVAEKPSVARDIARALGASKRGDGFLHGNGWVVTWAIGHLVRLAEPQEINPGWKRWKAEALPMLPDSWPLEVVERTAKQYRLVKKILKSPKVTEVICATDAGREGELIFRSLYEKAGCSKPIRRLWVSSLTREAILRGFEDLRSGEDYEPLAHAARCRSRADWLVGMNLSRACTVRHDELYTVGRVQTPTLAMVVERDIEIENFVPQAYFEVAADFAAVNPKAVDHASSTYQGRLVKAGALVAVAEPKEDEDPKVKNPGVARRAQPNGLRFFDEKGKEPTAELSKLIVLDLQLQIDDPAAHGQNSTIHSVKHQPRKMVPPKLYDLTELQRHANRLFGWSAKKTLGVAQDLYEQRKVISYPRTDSRYLSTDLVPTLPAIVDAVAGRYDEILEANSVAVSSFGSAPGSRFVADQKVTDHHAIVPTPKRASGLSRDEERLYDLVCRRFMSMWLPDHQWAQTEVITRVKPVTEAVRAVGDLDFRSKGKTITQDGWKLLDIGYQAAAGSETPRGRSDRIASEW